ncbi:uncharacterized protein LOC144423009 [Styela clava]
MLLCSLLVTVYITVAIDAYSHPTSFIYDKCGLTPKEDVDWSQIPSSVWYLSFISSNEIFTEVVNCQVIKNITNVSQGEVIFHVKNYYYSGSEPIEFMMKAFKTNETAAFWGIKDVEFIEANSQVDGRSKDTVAAKEAESFENGNTEIMYATDYSTYIIGIDCNTLEGNFRILNNCKKHLFNRYIPCL